MKLVKKVKILPTKRQRETFDFWLRRSCYLYNVALEERIIVYKATGKGLNVYEQKKELVDIKNYDPTWKEVPNKVLSDVIFRLDSDFKKFFSRGFKGFPKFKSKDFYNSISFVEMDVSVKDGKLKLPKIRENIRYRGELPSKHGTVSLLKEDDNFFLCFVTDFHVEEHENNGEFLGVDLGLKSLYTDSNGYSEDRFSLKLIKKYQKRIEELNRSLSTKKKGSKKRKKVIKHLKKSYRRLTNTKIDFLHKKSLKLVNRPESNIVIGDIKVNSIIQNGKTKKGMRRSFYVNSLSTFKTFLKYKTEKKGKKIIFVNEKNTSKTCSCCGGIKTEMSLSTRWYDCEYCKNSIDRDFNSAINMKLLGSSNHRVINDLFPINGNN